MSSMSKPQTVSSSSSSSSPSSGPSQPRPFLSPSCLSPAPPSSMDLAPPPKPAKDGNEPGTEKVAFGGFSRVSPFVRADPSDGYLARHYGIVSSTAPVVLSSQESVVSDDLGVVLDVVDKHRDLWLSMLPSRPAERAVDALSAVRSTVAALIDALHAHSVVRMCAVIYGRDMAPLPDAFVAPTASCDSEPALALRECVADDQALFRRHLARAIRGIRGLWVAREERQAHDEAHDQQGCAIGTLVPSP
ncbi:hypothetical protein pkur_cds_334 [Pandoravirus kuranda]|uniref:Uncharacterized protein n=1 Tax=Pandoravirus kuranda TaxID=3019033 RepID=A0AA95EDR6_9VIRU|nr:hypothetical protein pkur_cds_334 [Pandoravirus kuranda]